jgi:hypothetical protein
LGLDGGLSCCTEVAIGAIAAPVIASAGLEAKALLVSLRQDYTTRNGRTARTSLSYFAVGSNSGGRRPTALHNREQLALAQQTSLWIGCIDDGVPIVLGKYLFHGSIHDVSKNPAVGWAVWIAEPIAETSIGGQYIVRAASATVSEIRTGSAFLFNAYRAVDAGARRHTVLLKEIAQFVGQ